MSADIGKSIKQIREQRDLNQRELAKYAGISNVTMCKIEQGVLTPSLKTTIRIANVLRCSLDDLCGRSRNSRNSRHTISYPPDKSTFRLYRSPCPNSGNR